MYLFCDKFLCICLYLSFHSVCIVIVGLSSHGWDFMDSDDVLYILCIYYCVFMVVYDLNVFISF